MKTAILYIAERCNQDCVFCLEINGAWKPFVDPSTQEVYDDLGRLHSRGARHITFMGGETFFRKDLPKIIGHAKSLGFTRVGVTTNGTVLSKKGFVKNLIDAGLDFIEFSVHGHTPELANEIARTAYSYERQSEALEEINEIGAPFIIVNVVVCRENKDQLVGIADYVCRKLSNTPKKFKLKFVSTQGLAEQNADQGGLRYDEVNPIPVADFLEAKGVPFWFWNFPLCQLGRHASHSHDTGVFAVNETYFDYDHRGVGGYFDSGHQFTGHVWPERSCGSCTLKAICPGMEETHRRHFGDAALAGQTTDPLPILEGAIRDREGDPSTAAARLVELRKQPRPARAEIRRQDMSVVRFHHPDEQHDLEISISNRDPGKRAFIEAGRFALSYVPREDDSAPLRRPRVAAQMEAAGHALEAADARGADLEQAIADVAAATAEGWSSEANLPKKAAVPLVALTGIRAPAKPSELTSRSP